MSETRQTDILNFIQSHSNCSSGEIHKEFEGSISYTTVKRTLSQLLREKFILAVGKGKGTRYLVSPSYKLLYPIDIGRYYQKEIDDRTIIDGFNLSIFELLDKSEILTEKELSELSDLQQKYNVNTSQLSDSEYKKELERLAIDLSWKSSQIEGNTYSLLETERLLKERETAAGKTKEEAIMLLNHKDAIDFIVENPDYLEKEKINFGLISLVIL